MTDFQVSSPATSSSIVLTNKESYNSTDNLKIQINPAIAKRVQAIGKDAVEKELPSLNCSKNWITKTVSVDALAELIGFGMTWRPSVKDGGVTTKGNSKQDITSTDFACVDFDEGTKLEVTLKHPYTKYACFWHYTPSYKPGVNERHRIIFRLPNNISVADVEEILSHLIESYQNGCDKGAKDAGRFFYGASSPDHVHILDATAVLPVQEILANQWLPNSQSIFQEVKKPVQSIKNKRYSGSGFTYLVQDWLNLKLVVEKGLGVPDLYCLYLNPHNDKGHNFKKRDPDEVGMVAKYQGCNPWKESKDGNGDSFCVNQFQGRLPSFVDRFGACEIVNTKTGEIKHGGSLIDYWYLMKNEISGQWVGHSLQDCFAEVVRDICDHFKIEKFDFKDNKHKLEILKYYLSEELKGKLSLCKWQGASGFFAFDSIAKIWSYQANKDSLWINILNPLIKARYGKDVAENASYQKVLANWVFNNWNDEFLLTPKSEDTRYTPFSNGLYDTETKQLVSNDGRAFNLSRFAFDYQPASDDDPDILEFKNYWFEWIGCPVKAEFLLNWIIMNAQRKAGTVKNCIVILIGKKLCGKTFYHSFISKMLGIYGIVPDESFTSANNNHATAQLEGKYHIGLKELNQNMSPTLISRLMVLSGESGQKQMNVNPKGQASREITIQFGITGDAENELKLPSTQDGILRRFNLIKVPPTASRDDLEPARDRMLGNLQKILCWCLQQDFAAVKERFIELSKHDEIAGYTKQTVAESDPIYTFVQECLEVTNEDKDKETTADLYTLFTAWAKTQGLRYVLTKAKFKDLLPQTLYKNFAWYNSESEPPKESTQRCDQKYTKGFKRLLIDKVVRDELIQLSSY